MATAVGFIASLCNDIESWWNQPDVRAALQALIKRYANFSPDWKKHLELGFDSVLDGAR